ncbi:MAG: adenine deaminase [Desulfomonilaceae bacterium]|nr:adenine deaminase [Desulfomonilaceae bacterium]
MDLTQRIEVSLGKVPVDLLLTNGRLVNVFSGSIHDASIAIHRGRVVGFGDYDAVETVDLEGRYVSPGFIDGHLHLESSMLSIPEFARNVVPLGTTAVVADPHEIANVLGVAGIQYMLDSSEGLPLRVFIMFPSCVPATPFETSGAVLGPRDMEPFKNHERVLGLAEMMNFPGVLMEDPEVLAKIEVFRDRIKDGHAPGLSGKDLCAYVHAGITSDHECTTLQEAREKLGVGMRIMIREGSAAKNLDALLPLVNEHNSRYCFFVSDDTDPGDLREKGHINRLVGMAIQKGMDPLRAIQMATINTATYFRLDDLGAVLPGYRADLLILEDLRKVSIDRVYQGGLLTARNGELLEPVTSPSANLPTSMNVNWDKVHDLSIEARGREVNIIEVIPGQIVTKRTVESAPVENGRVVSDPTRDILKIAVIERHHGTGAFAVGLIRGFGLKEGAIGCTVAHDSHNIIVVGVRDEDLMAAARELEAMGGGMVVVSKAAVMRRLPLPIAGLMSNDSIEEVDAGLKSAVSAARKLGCSLENPFATLSFMALTPIPELKLTDQGLFDSVNFQFVSLFAD